MTCKQLGGACDKSFQASTFEEMARLSKQHAMEMYEKGDQPHLDAMHEMQKLMQNPEGMQQWMQQKQKQFTALPDL